MRPAALAGLIQAGLPFELALEKSQLATTPLIELALRVGAPLVPALELLERELQAQEKLLTEIGQAQAIPKATRKLLLWLPTVSVLLGELMGLRTISGLFTPLGFVALIVAVLLLWIGHKVTARLLSAMTLPDQSLKEQLVALDLCLSAGLGTREILDELSGQDQTQIRELIAFSSQTGASLRPLIAAELNRIYQLQLSQKLSEVKRLSVTLLIPLSLTTLPAFLLLTIPPMLIGITQ